MQPFVKIANIFLPVTRLLLTKKFVNRRLRFDSRIHGHKNVIISLQVSLTLGQVIQMQPLQKNSRNLYAICAIDLQQRLFRCSHRGKKICETRKKIRRFVSETRGNRSGEYLVSESRVHLFLRNNITQKRLEGEVLQKFDREIVSLLFNSLDKFHITIVRVLTRALQSIFIAIIQRQKLEVLF